MKHRFAILGLCLSLMVPAVCSAEPNFDVNAYVYYLQNKNNDDYRIGAIETLTKSSPRLSTDDVKAILKAFNQDDKREKAALILYPYVINKGNWFKIESCFTSQSSWRNLQASIDALPQGERFGKFGHAGSNQHRSPRDRGPRGERVARANINVDPNTFIHETSSGERQIDEAEYSGYLYDLRSDEQRIQALRKLMSVNPALYVVDLQSILTSLTEDAERVKAANMLYRYVVNKSNWFKLKDYFDDAKNWETVTASTVAHPVIRKINPDETADERRVRQVDEVGFVQYLRMQTSDDKRFKILQELANTNPAIYVSDVKAFMEVFPRTSDKKKVADMLYPYLINTDYWHEVTSLLAASEAEDELNHIVNNQQEAAVTASEEQTAAAQPTAAVAQPETSESVSPTLLPFVQTLASKEVDTERLVLVQNFVEMHMPLQVKDVKSILETFTFEMYRVKVAALLYANVSDKTQWDTLSSMFSSAEQWENVKAQTVNKSAAGGSTAPNSAPTVAP